MINCQEKKAIIKIYTEIILILKLLSQFFQVAMLNMLKNLNANYKKEEPNEYAQN